MEIHFVAQPVEREFADGMKMKCWSHNGQTTGPKIRMPGPANALPMMMGEGQFGNIEMGGMFTVLRVRDGISTYDDPGWCRFPEGSVARRT